MKVWNGRTTHKYAHVKRDGHCVIIKKDQFGGVKAYSRNMIPFPFRWHPAYDMLMTRVSLNTTIHAELWKPGEEASYVKSGIVNEDKSLILEVFAIPTLKHSLLLHEVADICDRWGLRFIPWYDGNYKRGHWHELCRGEFVDPTELPLTSHIEGYVMKDSNFSEFYKIKPFMSADLIVTDVKPGKGKYTGQVGALICSLADGTEVANISGFTDEERAMLSTQDIGRVVEVKYQKVGSRGRLRHPTFMRFRDDKLPSQCTEL